LAAGNADGSLVGPALIARAITEAINKHRACS
jgi:hypothetical protein